MQNVHTRVIEAPASVVGDFIDRIGAVDDRLSPTPGWAPIRFDRPLAVGATGGHGDVHYRVDQYEPGRRVRFEFAQDEGLDGFHELSVVADGAARCRLTHVMGGKLTGGMRIGWPLAVRWLHDAMIEDLFDNAEYAATKRLARSAKWSPWVRFLMRMMAVKPLAVDLPDEAELARKAFDRPDYTDAFSIPLFPGVPADPRFWAGAIFFHRPFPDKGVKGSEAMIGDSLKRLDFCVSVLIRNDELTMSTVVKFGNRMGRGYFNLIKPFHRMFVKFMLKRAVRVVGRAAHGDRLANEVDGVTT